MSDNPDKIRHYCTYMRMYGEIMQDLSHSEEYVIKLIDNDRLNELEAGLRTLIEKSLNQPIRS